VAQKGQFQQAILLIFELYRDNLLVPSIFYY